MKVEQRPLTEIEQGMLFLWLRQNCSLHNLQSLRKDLPDIAHNIFGTPMLHGIPEQLFQHVENLARGKHKIEAIKELRAHAGWSLKDAKDFIENHFRQHFQ